MSAQVTFFKVDNGDMTLLELESGRTILIDTNIRAAADDPDDDTSDVAKKLRGKLKRDDKGRLYVDALLLSHPDKDHCTGMEKHFHLAPPGEWSKTADKIFVRELWSSPIVFRRASRDDHVLCPDAQIFCKEARRRVQRFRDVGASVSDGDRILVLGEDQDGKTDDLTAILVKIDEVFTKVNGQRDYSFEARLLGPLPKSRDESEEEALAKNRSSTIMQVKIVADGNAEACYYLTGGDAEAGIWERLWSRHAFRATWLQYDLMLSPHHVSWHSLSYDSWSKLREKANVCKGARNALAEARKGAVIIGSSKLIKDDDNDPPCIRAKREYEDIARNVRGVFKCVADYPEGLEFEITRDGPRVKTKAHKAAAVVSGGIGTQPYAHGHPLAHG